MKLQLLCLFSLVSSVLASKGAGPYQTVFFWYAYRMEIEAFGEATVIAPKCPSPCDFDTFIKYIQKEPKLDRKGRPIGNITPFTGSTGIGNNLEPDVETAVDKLNAVGYQSVNSVNKLLPGTFPNDDRAPGLPLILDPMVQRIQEARQKLGNNAKAASILSKLQECMAGVSSARKQENAKNIIDAFNKEKDKRKYTFETKTMTKESKDGTKYTALDTEQMLADNQNAKENVKKFIQNFVTDYNSGKIQGANNPKGHFIAIEACEQVRNTLESPLPCT
ncbi:hypothetical protein VTN96DRAFT_8131 [Rasamsonia emersonii]|uniref:Uncharacterized protein n=1 Tax=Rasamsonia emersonii (strain ATCC 16479 / CBS 393.64 / IMI 116815) TaxID=1408163 RepID=A0A0F4YHS1_RASE3|nr:hypothetical protein T310_8419 [Rasamsonia emersonii CBS 393.64]KKA17640.1 hypothetical protein T310_8419 [Rasamsonia emersonii CBS 393.64]